MIGTGEEDPEQLLANPRNWRIHPREQQKALEGVLKQVGWVQNVIVNQRTGYVVDGHARVAMAITRGERVPVVYVDLSEEEEALILATLDPLSAMAGTDKDLLAGLVAELPAVTDADLQALLDVMSAKAGVVKPGLTGEDEAPGLPENPVTRAGDLWLCGQHRILCGDSTAADAVSRLLSPASGDLSPFLMVTDPPYGVEYDPTWRDGKGGFSTAAVKQRGKVENDDRCDWSAAYDLFPGAVAYIWHASLLAIETGTSILAAGFEIRGTIIWRKQQPLFGQGHYHWQHEPCWYAVRKGRQANWHGDRKQSTIWDVQNLNPTGNREETRTGHGTQKPVELMRRPIVNHTLRGEAVYDPFLGSGTTLIAAEQTERVCLGIDIDPKYVDVAILRWQEFTGQAATLDGDGRTFLQVSRDKFGEQLGAQDAIKEELFA